MFTREDIVRTARELIGAPFKHQGRGPKFDCAGVVVVVARRVDAVELAFDVNNYDRQPNPKEFLKSFRTHMDEIPVLQARDGDVIIVSDPVDPTATNHCGILTSKFGQPHIVHGYARAKKVTEDPMTFWNDKRVAAFRFRGLSE